MTFKEPVDPCYKCEHERKIEGSSYVRCEKPDYSLLADQHGVDMGYFNYPNNYDPIWKSSVCKNFKLKEAPLQGEKEGNQNVGKESI